MKKRTMAALLGAGICGDFAPEFPTKENTVLDVFLFIPTHSLMSK